MALQGPAFPGQRALLLGWLSSSCHFPYTPLPQAPQVWAQECWSGHMNAGEGAGEK